MTTYGFVAEPHKDGYWFVNPATEDSGSITCHDLSGFCGSWEMKNGGKFFPSTDNTSLCSIAMNQAISYAQENNREKQNEQ